MKVLGFEAVHDSPGTEGKPIAYVRLAGGSMIELTTRPGGEPIVLGQQPAQLCDLSMRDM